MGLFKKREAQSENYTRADDNSKAERRRRYVYKHTEKPTQYVHVDEPKTLQDERQIQFNNWCKRNGVYNGSYLPTDPDTLTEKGKGWDETTSPKRDKERYSGRDFTRRSTGQEVSWNDGEDVGYGYEDPHYHWNNPDKKSDKKRFDRYGNPTKDKRASHLAPLDKDYNYIEHKKTKRRKKNAR